MGHDEPRAAHVEEQFFVGEPWGGGLIKTI